MSDLDVQVWIDEAKRADLVAYARHRSPKLRFSSGAYTGPCPACGGDDRFSINLRKRNWWCRGSLRGGDVINLVAYVERVEFLQACEILTGRPRPGRDPSESPEDRARREAELLARREAAVAEEAERAKRQDHYRTVERSRARRIWARAEKPLAGTPVEAYLRLRGIAAPDGARLRFAPALPFFVGRKGEDERVTFVEVYRGPAMVAGIQGPDGLFTGVHQTWIDLTDADGKLRLADPETGELQPAKKVRGSVHGARIELVRHAAPRRLFLGEGIETVLSAHRAAVLRDLPQARDAAAWSGVSLGNICGRALDRVRHPTLRIKDSLGRERAKRVPGAEPDPSDAVIPIPGSVEELILLGDGDSDRFTTDLALRRAAQRFLRPGLTIRIVWAEPGHDFNSMLRAA